jgi:hypothetical protein
MSISKTSMLLALAGMLFTGGVFWFTYNFSGQISWRGGGRVGTTPPGASEVSAEASGNVSSNLNPAPERVSLTGLWISERSGKPYFLDETNGKITVFEGVIGGSKREVGRGDRTGRKIIIQFQSTLDSVEGALELALSDDSQTLDGRFRGFDPTEEGPVRLLRSTH